MNNRDKSGNLVRPVFLSQVPPELLTNCSPADRWMYEHQSIQEQQNEWLISQALNADAKQRDLEDRIDSLVGIKRSSALAFVSWILIPGALVALGAWLTHFFEKK